MSRLAEPVDLSGRRMIVTGASRGSLGAATASILAGRGAHVVVTTRADSEAAAAAIGDGVVGYPLDLTDHGSVVAFVDWYAESFGADGLDVLINNAGIHLDLRSTWKEPRLTPDGYEIHWRTNYLGTMQLTALLLPVLVTAGERTGDARVVNVVSKLHDRGRNRYLFEPLTPYQSWDAYGLSKLAMIHASTELTRRNADRGVRGWSLHPGSVYSNIADRGLEGHPILSRFRTALAPVEKRMLLSPEVGAQTSVFCATAPDVAPGYYRDCAAADTSEDAIDAKAAARLWDETSQWVASLRA